MHYMFPYFKSRKKSAYKWKKPLNSASRGITCVHYYTSMITTKYSPLNIYIVYLENGLDQLIVTLYIHPSVHNQLIRTLFEEHIVY